MKILITGGCGFIGSNFIHYIINNEKYSEILNIDKITYAGNPNNLKKIDKSRKYKFEKGDICDLRLLNELITNFKPQAIIHFAAESHVDRSIESPQNFIKTNILGTSNLLIATSNYLNSLNKVNKKNFRFINISTDEVFGSLGKNDFFTENTSYSPNSPYSASKASSDHLVRAWNKTYDLPAIITNCSNNYGPYQFPEKLIPLIIANCVDQKKLPVYGKGQNIRDWLYVKDHCKAIELILLNGKLGETYNIGGGNEISNIEIVKTICKIMDDLKPLNKSKKYEELITFVPDRPGHDFRYAIDSTKVKKSLNWLPKESFKTGISKTVKWYLKNEKWWRKIQNKSYKQERLGLI